MPLKKLNPTERQSTDELIHTIERKDRRFRLFQSIFMIGTFVALIFLIGAQQRTLANVQTQVAEQEKTAEAARIQREEQLQKITRRLDCMVVFFSTPNRENLTIENVENCSLNRDEDLNKFFQNKPDNSSENPPNLPGSAPTATQENAEAQGQQQNGSQEQNSGSQEENSPEQVYIFGIPVCVPFTKICVQQ